MKKEDDEKRIKWEIPEFFDIKDPKGRLVSPGGCVTSAIIDKDSFNKIQKIYKQSWVSNNDICILTLDIKI